MNEYLNGSKLYGDDFDLTMIAEWFNDESEGYANIGSKDAESYDYSYHRINEMHSFKFLKHISEFENVLGLGAAYGHEFLPILKKIKNLYIIESSDNLVSRDILGLIPHYKKPKIDGTIDFESNFFNLITSFGVLHHIPNVTFVINEIYRVLKPGGYFLLREPIVSMGDWTLPRKGLTKNERGIPKRILHQIVTDSGFHIEKETYCLTLTSIMQKKIGKLFNLSLINYSGYLHFDRLISKLSVYNYKYHSTKFLRQIRPSVAILVLVKE